MAALPTDLRNKLERAIIEARNVAETGAKAALEALAVHHHEPYPHQKPDQRKLRVQLRAHARQLGDAQNPKGGLAIGHLIHECAYEHWHRMLFARFLAENDLLIEPDSGMAISLGEAEELAKSVKVDLWTYASRCSQQMLPQIFRPDDPVLQVGVANEHRVKLERLLAGLASDTFKADDSLGWVYQFWQSAEKDRVNASGEKITGDTLPAVTQLFTEHYMVLFLLHNTIGAWHAGKVLAANPKLAETAASEDALRQAVALKTAGGYSFDYLRFVRGADGKGGPWRPAAGTFDGWPKTAAQLKTLDPCCGSGHFLVAKFELLVRLRMGEENLSIGDAIDAVIRDNIHGLELDARCTQIAAFNLAMAAWKFAGYRKLRAMQIACTGIAPQATLDQWLKLAEPAIIRAPLRDRDPLRLAIRGLHGLFSDAPTLGSLIDPNPASMIGAADWETVEPYLISAMQAEVDDEEHERAVAAAGIVTAAKLLAGEYTLVITNVPYLKRGNQGDSLASFALSTFPEAKADLATMFAQRWLDSSPQHGSVAMVIQHNFLFQDYYKSFRHRLLNQAELSLLSRLGTHAFETISGEVVSVCLLITHHFPLTGELRSFGIDASSGGATPAKVDQLRDGPIVPFEQKAMLQNPGYRISFADSCSVDRLCNRASHSRGISSGDDVRFSRHFAELGAMTPDWSYFQNSCDETSAFGGCGEVFYWQGGTGEFFKFVSERLGAELVGQWIRGRSAWGRMGIAISATGKISSTLYLGDLFHQNLIVVTPNVDADLAAIWSCCSDPTYGAEVRKLDQSLKVGNAVVQVPFDEEAWQAIAESRYPHGLPEPESDYPTEWLFHGRPECSTAPLQVGVARLLGYRWPAELDDKMRLSKRARGLVAKAESLLKFADEDGIVCIPSVRSEEPAADRLLALLSACGVKPDPSTGSGQSRNLDEWLRNDFFKEHCDLFHQRPFIWHIWDGRKRDGFHALVNYHKLAHGKEGKKLLESLTYSYLGDWINRQKDGVKRGEDGAEDRLAAATELQKRLAAIIEGEPPHDIFVRWKPLAEQAIGWEPDINDGVRMNIRPFLASDLPGGRAGAGVLRWKPNIKWDKDRGKEPERKKFEFPWFWGWDESTADFIGGREFKGERFNNCHYTNAVKQQVREAAKKVGR